MAKRHLKNLQASSKKRHVEHASTGKRSRECAPGSTLFWRNAVGTVQNVSGGTATVFMQGTSKLMSDFPSSQLYLTTGKEKLPMIAKLDYTKVLLLQKLVALQGTGDTQFTVSGASLGGT